MWHARWKVVGGCAEKRTKKAETGTDKDSTIGFSPSVPGMEWTSRRASRRGVWQVSLHHSQVVRCFTSHSRIKPIRCSRTIPATRTRDPLKRVAGVSTRWPTIAANSVARGSVSERVGRLSRLAEILPPSPIIQ